MSQSVSPIVIEEAVSNRYQVGRKLGKGGYGVVHEALDTSTGRQVAVKFIPKARIGAAVDRIQREIEVMQALDHPRVLKMHNSFTTDLHYVIVMEKVDGGELLQHLLKVRKYTERKACRIIFNVLRALRHMHVRGFMHCDLKPENLLLVKKPSTDEEVTSCKLADFGLARPCRPDNLPTQACGSPMYIAPEVLEAGVNKTRSHYDHKADLWSLGIITYLLLSGMIPFYAPNPKDIFKLVLASPHSMDTTAWAPISEEGKAFVNALLEKAPARRMSAQEALAHPWMEMCAEPDDERDAELPDSMERLKAFNPHERLMGAFFGVEAVMRISYLIGAQNAGLRANTAVMERLAEIGPNETLTTIDLTNNYLGARGLVALCDTLTAFPRIKSLILTNVLLDDDKFITLVPFLMRPTCILEQLICDNNELSNVGGRALCGLVAQRTNYTRVTVHNNKVKPSLVQRLANQCVLNGQRRMWAAATLAVRQGPPAVLSPRPQSSALPPI